MLFRSVTIEYGFGESAQVCICGKPHEECKALEYIMTYKPDEDNWNELCIDALDYCIEEGF